MFGNSLYSHTSNELLFQSSACVSLVVTGSKVVDPATLLNLFQNVLTSLNKEHFTDANQLLVRKLYLTTVRAAGYFESKTNSEILFIYSFVSLNFCTEEERITNSLISCKVHKPV